MQEMILSRVLLRRRGRDFLSKPSWLLCSVAVLAVAFLLSGTPWAESVSPKDLLKGKNAGTTGIDPKANPADDEEKDKSKEEKEYRVLDVPEKCQWFVKPGSLADSCCGPTSLHMVMAYYGKKVPIPDICKKARTDKWGGSGTLSSDLVRTAEAYGFENIKDRRLQGHHPLRWLKSQILEGRPVIVNVNSSWNRYAKDYLFKRVNGKWVPHNPYREAGADKTTGLWACKHSMVVIGITKNGIVVNDPEARTPGGKADTRQVIPVDKFMAMWKGYFQCQALVLKPYSHR